MQSDFIKETILGELNTRVDRRQKKKLEYFIEEWGIVLLLVLSIFFCCFLVLIGIDICSEILNQKNQFQYS